MFVEGDGRIAVGEKSADYLFWHPAHARMHGWIPGARIILTLRNPIERAWSMYWNEIGRGEKRSASKKPLQQNPTGLPALPMRGSIFPTSAGENTPKI